MALMAHSLTKLVNHTIINAMFKNHTWFTNGIFSFMALFLLKREVIFSAERLISFVFSAMTIVFVPF